MVRALARRPTATPSAPATGGRWPSCTPRTPPTAGTRARTRSSWPSAGTRSATLPSASRWAGSTAGTYPYQKVLIDEAQGEVVGFWKQIAGAQRPDGVRPTRSPGSAAAGSLTAATGSGPGSATGSTCGNATALFIEMIKADGCPTACESGSERSTSGRSRTSRRISRWPARHDAAVVASKPKLLIGGQLRGRREQLPGNRSSRPRQEIGPRTGRIGLRHRRGDRRRPACLRRHRAGRPTTGCEPAACAS